MDHYFLDTRYLVTYSLKWIRTSWTDSTVCPGSSDPFFIVCNYIKWVTTSWTHSIMKSDVIVYTIYYWRRNRYPEKKSGFWIWYPIGCIDIQILILIRPHIKKTRIYGQALNFMYILINWSYFRHIERKFKKCYLFSYYSRT